MERMNESGCGGTLGTSWKEPQGPLVGKSPGKCSSYGEQVDTKDLQSPNPVTQLITVTDI
jgi:hypothetical protein